jgi:hypothetical protein
MSETFFFTGKNNDRVSLDSRWCPKAGHFDQKSPTPLSGPRRGVAGRLRGDRLTRGSLGWRLAAVAAMVQADQGV